MFSTHRVLPVLCLILLNLGAALAQFSMSVASDEVAIGQKFTVSWSLGSFPNEPDSVDICLNDAAATQFIPVGSITRNGATSGAVNITLDDTIFPSTYTLGIRFTGCSFLLAQIPDFEVVSPFCGVSPRAIPPPSARSLPPRGQ